ncbi:MAG TPA: CDP-alcohol phosphatidyltransferase family protein [Vicinamibacterales bacterium]|nr:CDP-alcohol phosphatidyltransferase family protein [Vicinamibacterales bacterium]
MPPILPWIAHLYTATGAVIALLATAMTFAHNFRAVFIYFVVATFVDSTDGVLARALKVKERLPHFDGAKLDDIIDYLMYVFVPALVVWQADLVPSAFPICAAMVLSSAYGFAHNDAKVASHDHFFTGFPSYWNIVVVYLYLAHFSQLTNAIILVTLAILVFVPIRYVYPSRTMALKWPTLLLGTMWAIVFTWIVWRLPAVDGPWTMISLVFPVYYVALSLWLQFRR